MDKDNAFSGTMIFPANDIRLKTQVGERTEDKIISTGQSGCLMFGPYLPLEVGRYQVIFHCTVGANGLAGASFDVVADQCKRVFIGSAFVEPDGNGCFVVPPISLDAPCTDLEVRVWITDQTDLQISKLEIVALETGRELVDAEPVVVAAQDTQHQDDNLITQSFEDTRTVDQEMVLTDTSLVTGQNITQLTRKERKLIKAKRKKKN